MSQDRRCGTCDLWTGLVCALHEHHARAVTPACADWTPPRAGNDGQPDEAQEWEDFDHEC